MRNYQIGLLKSAATSQPQPVGKYAPAAGYKYQQTPEGLNNPYVPQVLATPAPPPESMGMAAGKFAGEVGSDMLLGQEPVTGVPWFAGKAIYHGLKGNWGGVAMDVGQGMASFLPGANAAVGAGQAAVGAARVGRVASALGKYKGAITAAQDFAAPAVAAAKAVPAVAKVGAGIDRVGGVIRGAAPQIGAGKLARGFAGVRNLTADATTYQAKRLPFDIATGMLPSGGQSAPPPAPPMPSSDYFSNGSQ